MNFYQGSTTQTDTILQIVLCPSDFSLLWWPNAWENKLRVDRITLIHNFGCTVCDYLASWTRADYQGSESLMWEIFCIMLDMERSGRGPSFSSHLLKFLPFPESTAGWGHSTHKPFCTVQRMPSHYFRLWMNEFIKYISSKSKGTSSK